MSVPVVRTKQSDGDAANRGTSASPLSIPHSLWKKGSVFQINALHDFWLISVASCVPIQEGQRLRQYCRPERRRHAFEHWMLDKTAGRNQGGGQVEDARHDPKEFPFGVNWQLLEKAECEKKGRQPKTSPFGERNRPDPLRSHSRS